eukprot:SAG11_NODE_21485_length_424_cov_0.867692_1_plen_51_part_10
MQGGDRADLQERLLLFGIAPFQLSGKDFPPVEAEEASIRRLVGCGAESNPS